MSVIIKKSYVVYEMYRTLALYYKGSGSLNLLDKDRIIHFFFSFFEMMVFK